MKHVIRHNPMGVLSDINKLFEQTFYPSSGNVDSSAVETSEWIPSVDIKEEKNQFHILMDLPGIDKKDINISMESNVLRIQGERKSESEEKRENYYRCERVTGTFYRRFTLPETADEQKIQANMKKGVLEIVIPKKEIAKPKEIEIVSEES